MVELFITEQQALNELCLRFSTKDVVAIDTEFVRTRTYFPKLGLLQLCDGEVVALIDPLSVEDLSPVWQLLENPKVTKVLHACSEDVEIFVNQGNCSPQNVIDSQIVMSFLGHGLSVGYAAMVKHYLNIELDKSDSRTDWIKRPLTDSQLVYASADVTHLITLYPLLIADIEKTTWLNAAKIESAQLIVKKQQTIDENSLYKNVKTSWRLTSKQLNNLKYLARWRYQQALKRDLPLSFVAKDNTLMGLSQYAPKSMSAMLTIDGVDTLDIRHKGKQMLRVLQEASRVSDEDYPEKIKRLDQCAGYKQLYKKVKNFVSSVAVEHQLPVENLASKKQINQLLSWYYGLSSSTADIDILQSWRGELFGEDLLQHAKNQFSSLPL
ncbi:ribonuclease D [Thalassotalea sp. 1_MG-2023]|uniref:ribonuclease D n=1 Tax=Thalassotalea sp. 1_MG-2023 TaxID=3062680 RepID=UPI0026E1E726|nr:ribonuclease D [Thalassotalea sp. 1_MG-2023]MDO6427295.1 ribonuclease D [Thalassotalea sp. 1_MG-2023]